MIHVFLKGVELRWQQYSFLSFMNEGIIGAPIHNIDYRLTKHSLHAYSSIDSQIKINK